MTIQLDLETLAPWLWVAGSLLYCVVGVIVVRVASWFSGRDGLPLETDACFVGLLVLGWPMIVVVGVVSGAVALLGRLATPRGRKG